MGNDVLQESDLRKSFNHVLRAHMQIFTNYVIAGLALLGTFSYSRAQSVPSEKTLIAQIRKAGAIVVSLNPNGVKTIELSEVLVTDELLEKISKLSLVEEVFLSSVELSDGQLNAIFKLSGLNRLSFINTKLSSKGLGGVINAKELRDLT